VFDRIPLRGDYGEYCIDLSGPRPAGCGFTVREVPYHCAPRLRGESKTATSAAGYIKRGWKYVVTILRLGALPGALRRYEMLKPVELTLEELGDRADLIPAPGAELKGVDLPQSRSQSWTWSGRFIPVCEPALEGNETPLCDGLPQHQLDLVGRQVYQPVSSSPLVARWAVARELPASAARRRCT